MKTNFSLFPSYSVHKSLNHKHLFLKPQLSVKYFTKKPTQHTSYFTEHTSLSRRAKIISIISKCQPKKTITHVLGPTYISWALNMGTCISCNEQWATTGTDVSKNAAEWTRRIAISKEEIPGSRHSMHGYTRTCSRL